MIAHDITRPLRAGIAPWPGDAPYTLTRSLSQDAGDTVTLSEIALSLHTGTHTDAPLHTEPDGASIEVAALSAYIGPCTVLDATGIDVIEGQHFAGVDFARTPRVLLKTLGWPDSTQFPAEVPVLADGVAAQLGRAGCVLLGVDVPSVDRIESKTLPNHHALNAAHIRIIEGLDLSNVPPGEYDLIALPLSFVGGDASPLRAVLVRAA